MKIEARRAIQQTSSYWLGVQFSDIIFKRTANVRICTIIMCIFSDCISILYTYSLSTVLDFPFIYMITSYQARRVLFNFAMQDHNDYASADRGRMARWSHILFNKLKHSIQNKNNNNVNVQNITEWKPIITNYIKMIDTTQRWIVIVLCIDEVWQYTFALIIQNSS